MGELRDCRGVVCDRKMPVMLQGKIYRIVENPALMYGAETWATTKGHKRRLDVNEMRMLRWMCGVTKKDEDAAMDMWSDKER